MGGIERVEWKTRGHDDAPGLVNALTAAGFEAEEVESIKRSAQAPVSLEKPVGDEEESEFGQFIADERAESPYERAAEILTKEALREALENLSYRERRVLELRDKIGAPTPATPTGAPEPPSPAADAWRAPVTEALVGLGWSAEQAEAGLDQVADELGDAPEMSVALRAALRELGR